MKCNYSHHEDLRLLLVYQTCDWVQSALAPPHGGGRATHHKLDAVEEALVELVVLELVLWAVCTVHHPTGLAAGCPKLLLTRILGGGG